jgi:predicted transcriptional regulator
MAQAGIASLTKLIYDDDIIYHADKTMRTLVDLGDTQVQALDELSKREKRSRAALIRLAIDEYLAKRHSKQEGDAFGLWGKRKVDGLVYQEKVRSEW